MKLALVGVLVVLGVLAAVEWRAHQRAEQALVAAVCANELTEPLAEMIAQTQAAMKEGNTVAGAALYFKRMQLYEQSSLAPHLGTIRRWPQPSLDRIKAMAAVASQTCPDVFPEPIKAEKPLGVLWLMAFDDR